MSGVIITSGVIIISGPVISTPPGLEICTSPLLLSPLADRPKRKRIKSCTEADVVEEVPGALRSSDISVKTAREAGLKNGDDQDLLGWAHGERIPLLTFDQGFMTGLRKL